VCVVVVEGFNGARVRHLAAWLVGRSVGLAVGAFGVVAAVGLAMALIHALAFHSDKSFYAWLAPISHSAILRQLLLGALPT
jgi:hypothetical protein